MYVDDEQMSKIKDCEKPKEKGGKPSDQQVQYAKAWRARWKVWYTEYVEPMQKQRANIQKHIKAICARVRNEYATRQLKVDFDKGFNQMLVHDDDTEVSRTEALDSDAESESEDDTDLCIPEACHSSVKLEVFCISANDYLKITGIKPVTDGQPAAFSNVADTNIPALSNFVHQTTSKARVMSARLLIQSSLDLAEQVHLLLVYNGNTSTESATACKQDFDKQMETFFDCTKSSVCS